MIRKEVARRSSLVLAALAIYLSLGGASAGAAEIGGGTAAFEGGTISMSEAAERGYACDYDASFAATCYRTQEESDAAAGIPPGGAASSCGRVAYFWENRNFRGWRISVAGRPGVWVNLGAPYKDAISAFKMSRWGGKIASRRNGEGNWLQVQPCEARASLGEAWASNIASVFIN